MSYQPDLVDCTLCKARSCPSSDPTCSLFRKCCDHSVQLVKTVKVDRAERVAATRMVYFFGLQHMAHCMYKPTPISEFLFM